MIQDVYRNSNNLEETFVKISEKNEYFITEFIDVLATIRGEFLFGSCGGQTREKIISLLMIYNSISIKLFIFKFLKGNLMLSINGALLN